MERKPIKFTDMVLGRPFQNIRLFKDLTVLDNVMIAMHCKNKVGHWLGYSEPLDFTL